MVVAETPIGPIFESAAGCEASGVDPVATRGLGDAALSWALQNLDRLSHADAVPLVLIEDGKLAVRLQGLNRGHILSTRSWLAALDEAGIADYVAVVSEMARHGRGLSALAVDAPVDAGADGSVWLDGIVDRNGRSE